MSIKEEDVLIVESTVQDLVKNKQLADQVRPELNRFGIDTNGMDDAEILAIAEKIKNYRKESVQVLSRGPVLDGLQRILSKVPAEFVGQFFLDTPVEINRAEAMGWKVHVDKNLSKESPTAPADGRVIMGDCILMVIPRELRVAQLMEQEQKYAEKRRRNDFKFGVPQGDGIVDADPEFPVFKWEG